MNRTRTVLLAGLCLIGVSCSHALMAQTNREAAEHAFAAGEIQKALEIWMLLAYEGDAVAQARLGALFDEGTGTVVDPSEAVYWYQRAAEQGEADAQYRLGSAYHQGRGVKPDRKQALYWWKAAAENDHPEAQFDLGRALFYGEDVDQDLAQAERWLSLAADQGHSGAQAFLNNVSALTDESSGETTYARIGTQPLFAYATFNRFAPILQRLEPGALVEIVTRRRGWLEVSTPGGFPVWVEATDIEAFDSGLRIVPGGAPARPEPSNAVTARPVGALDGGTAVSVLEEKNEWRRVRAPESVTAWVEAIGVEELGPRSDDLIAEWEQLQVELSEAPSRIKVVVDMSPQDEAEADVASDDDVAPVDEVSVAATVAVPTTQGNQVPADGDDSGEVESKPKPTPTPLPVSGSVLEVGTDGVALLAAGTVDATVIDTLDPGTRLLVRNVDGEFLEVEVAGGFPLWVFGQYVRQEGETGVITGDGVRARPRPGTSDDSPPLDTFAKDSVVEVVEVSEQWVRVRMPESSRAWVRNTGLKRITPEEDGAVAALDRAEEAAEPALPEEATAAEAASLAEDAAGGDKGISETPAPGATGDGARSDDASEAPLARTGDVTMESPTGVSEMSEAAPDGAMEGASEEVGVDAPADDRPVAAAPDGPGEASPPVSELADRGTEDGEAIDEASNETITERDSSKPEEITTPAPTVTVAGQDEASVAAVETSAVVQLADDGGEDIGTDAGSDRTGEPDEEVGDDATDDANLEPTMDPDVAADVDTAVDESAEEGQSASDPLQSVEPAEELPTIVGQSSNTIVDPTAGPEDVAGAELLEEHADTPSSEPEAVVAVEPEPVAVAPEAPWSGSDDSIADTDESESFTADPADMAGEGGAVDESQVRAGIDEAVETDEAAQEMAASVDLNGSESQDETVETEITDEVALASDATEPSEDLAEGDESGSQEKDVIVALVSPVPEASQTDLDRSRLAALPEPDARIVETRFNDFGWLFGQDPDHFSLELFSTTSHAMVRQFVETYPIDGPVVYFETEQGGRKWYFVLSGAYPDMAQVREAAEKLPSELDAIRVRRFGVLQDIKCRLVDDLTFEEFAKLEALCRQKFGG